MTGWDGVGNFDLPYDWNQDKINGIKIRADRMQTTDAAIATGLEACLTRNGETTPSANTSWNSKKITNLLSGTADTDAANVGQIAALTGVRPGYRTGSVWIGSGPFQTLGTATLTADRLYAVPIYISETTTFDRIGINVTTGSGAFNARLGIYNNSAGAPSTLVLDCGTVSVAAVAAVAATISQSLTPGWYWLVLVTDGTPAVSSGLLHPGWLEQHAAQADIYTPSNSIIRTTFTYAALPTPFPTITYANVGTTPTIHFTMRMT